MRTHAELLAAVVLLAGCPATAVHRSADPVAPGQWRVGGALGVGTLRDTEQETRLPYPVVELSARRGVAEDLDVGARVGLSGLDVNATWRVARRGRWSYALAPSLGGLRARESGLSPRALHLFGHAALIASRPVSARWTLSFGPTAGGGLYWPETGGHADGGWLGAFVNGGVRLGGAWTIVTELSVLSVVAGEVPVAGTGAQLGVAIAREL